MSFTASVSSRIAPRGAAPSVLSLPQQKVSRQVQPTLRRGASASQQARLDPTPLQAPRTDAAWQRNYVTHTTPAVLRPRERAPIDPATVHAYTMEVQNREDPTRLVATVADLCDYAATKGLALEVLLAGPTAVQLQLRRQAPQTESAFHGDLARLVAWMLFNRGSNAVSLRPQPPAAGAWRADQVLTLQPMSPLTPPGPPRDPEATLVDGFHVHMDHPPSQAGDAATLQAHYTEYAGAHALYYTDLDAYPPGANGPHVQGGWEVKFEKAGATVLERYGYTLAWMLLNHRDVPVYSHAKTWYLGENEERLRAHTDYALHMGHAPELDLAFFCDPQRGLLRWDAHLPDAGSPSPEHAASRREAVLQAWFAGDANVQQAFWFAKQAAGPRDIDATLRSQFLRDLPRAALGAYDDWLATPQGKVAFVILLDQFPRNIFRGTPAAFAYDHLALAVAQGAVDAGEDRALPLLMRLFLYLPFIHSEHAADQARGVACIEALHREAAPQQKDLFAEHARMARLHQKAVELFGRLPSRNAILKRPSTPAEMAFLTHPDHSF